MPTPCNSIESKSLALNMPETPVFDLQNPFGGQPKDFEFDLSRNRAGGGSTEFSVDQSLTSESEGSRPFSLINRQLLDNEEDDSFDVEFKLDDSEDSGSCSKSLPFSKHLRDSDQWKSSNNNSFSVQFEDSGCAENEKSSKSESSVMFTNSHTDQNSNNFRLDMPASGSGQRSTSASSAVLQHSKDTDVPSDISEKKTKQSSVAPTQKLYLFIQMQLCKRETLKEWLNSNTKLRNTDAMLTIFGQIVCAIEYVHSCGLMHRDLKVRVNGIELFAYFISRFMTIV